MGHVVKNYSDYEIKTRCRHFMGYYFRLAARGLLYAPFHRQCSTGTKIAQWSQPSRVDLMTHSIVSGYSTSKLSSGSILHGVDPLSYFSFQPVLHDWCNKGCGMCYPVCGMVHIKEPLLLIDKSSLCGRSGFPFSLSEWSLTICLTPYNRR